MVCTNPTAVGVRTEAGGALGVIVAVSDAGDVLGDGTKVEVAQSNASGVVVLSTHPAG